MRHRWASAARRISATEKSATALSRHTFAVAGSQTSYQETAPTMSPTMSPTMCRDDVAHANQVGGGGGGLGGGSTHRRRMSFHDHLHSVPADGAPPPPPPPPPPPARACTFSDSTLTQLVASVSACSARGKCAACAQRVRSVCAACAQRVCNVCAACSC